MASYSPIAFLQKTIIDITCVGIILVDVINSIKLQGKSCAFQIDIEFQIMGNKLKWHNKLTNFKS